MSSISDIIEEFISNNIEVLGSNPDNNVLGFSVSSTDESLIRDCVYNGYSKFFSTLEFKSYDWVSMEDLYNLTILTNIDRSNILIVL